MPALSIQEMKSGSANIHICAGISLVVPTFLTGLAFWLSWHSGHSSFRPFQLFKKWTVVPPICLRRDQSGCSNFSDSSGFLLFQAFWVFQLSAIPAVRSFWLFSGRSSTCKQKKWKKVTHTVLPTVKESTLKNIGCCVVVYVQWSRGQISAIT